MVTCQMDPSTLAPAPTGHTKQYVFVDEYNRHKRLKVMRACDGCRKRKIKCDGALQNGPWPCGACTRLKLKCVPPTLDQDDEQPFISTAGQGQYSFHNSTLSSGIKPDIVSPRAQRVQQWAGAVTSPAVMRTPASAPMQNSLTSNGHLPESFSHHPGHRLDQGYPDGDYLASIAEPAQFGGSRQMPSLLRSHTEHSGSSGGDPQEVEATMRELSEHMGELSIETTSVAHYIANEKKTLAETPAVEEVEIILPPSVSTDSTVRIPPEMMLSDERVMDYFGYFFSFIHPYVPVLNRATLYEQWHSARHSISPLILEGIFACVSRYLEEPLEVRKWLALAARHEESFKDVPRLSTIQAMILLTKAREFSPRRGYYYRSWMAVKYMVNMAVDLSLHEHCDQDHSRNACKLTKADCMVRTRIWQSLFNLEILVGAPQGRTDFSVEVDTVSSTLPVACPEVDAFEHQTSRRFTFFTQTFRNIKHSNVLWQNMRRYKKDWALDPAFVRHNDHLVAWLKQLPPDLQIHYPEDGSPPWLGGDHFLAYVHCYHHLVVVMHHRPQLQALLEKRDPLFKHHLDICLQSASMMCRIQEALVRDFGLHGLHFMQRGVNFTIYCVLTCTMLHLAAITSPDPEFNSQARMFFTRHMRVLEQCISSASAEMQAQINALREAFSNDTSKPFELKSTLGLRSPVLGDRPTAPDLRHVPTIAPEQATSAWAYLQDATSSKTMSPTSEFGPGYDHISTHGLPDIPNMPAAAPYNGASFHPPAHTTYASQTLQQVTSAAHTGYALEPAMSSEQQASPVWDPSGIFTQWNSAFGGAAPPPQQIPDPRVQQTQTSLGQQQQQPPMYHPHQTPPIAGARVQEHHTPPVPTVTPLMWQDAFTTAYVSGHGNKRYRVDEGGQSAAYVQGSKRRA
ncbi:hypothetical protein LTR08_001150 [Meristemomyces frigidus]|nr:hypothetical protein LTR08_001150 [Meristemomyces frigidus]